MKLYIVGKCRDTYYYLLTEKGECLTYHFCSSESFAEGDLYRNHPERIKEYKERFGKVEVLWPGDDDMTEEELLKRNSEFYKGQDNMQKNI